ncbi:MAG TPA: class I SAM-dependent methyltransferase [Bacteroidales bacterium]|nr:class I SAM-dependent methyltransferase [Bacteroidales bacterium]
MKSHTPSAISYICEICNNVENNKTYTIEEKMYKTGDSFIYFKCAKCGCLQISEFPSDIAKFYDSSNYYSLQPKNKYRNLVLIRDWLKKQLFSYYMENKNAIGFVMKKIYNDPYYWFPKKKLNFNSRILDVGCGSGGLLRQMAEGGFQNLYGIEPFLENNIQYKTAKGVIVNIENKQLSEINQKYDFIMLHHVFEHMPNPHDVIENLKKLMSEDAQILIRIPIVDSYFWRKYKLNWFQIDAPRHFFLHSLQSIRYILQTHGLKIENLLYDGIWSTFYLSEKYQRGLSMLSENYNYTKEEKKKYQKKIKRLNLQADSDQICLLISKI